MDIDDDEKEKDGEGSKDDSSPSPSSLPCIHRYHSACLMGWVNKCKSVGVPSSCPLCRVAFEDDDPGKT